MTQSSRPTWQKAILGLFALPFIALGFLWAFVWCALAAGFEAGGRFITK